MNVSVGSTQVTSCSFATDGSRPFLRSIPTRRSSDLTRVSATYSLSGDEGAVPELPAQLPGSGAAGSRQRFTAGSTRSEEHTSELQSPCNNVCRLLLEKKNSHRSSHQAFGKKCYNNYK